jgi:hypothetical protein
MPTMFVVLDRDAGFDPDDLLGGRALATHADALSKLSEKLGVADLYDFFSAEPGDYDLGGDDDEDDDGEEDDADDDDDGDEDGAEFFFPDKGLVAVDALIAHLEGPGKKTKGAKDILVDLKDLKTVLEKARSAKARWHLAIDV